jgi:hypothetical protein
MIHLSLRSRPPGAAPLGNPRVRKKRANRIPTCPPRDRLGRQPLPFEEPGVPACGRPGRLLAHTILESYAPSRRVRVAGLVLAVTRQRRRLGPMRTGSPLSHQAGAVPERRVLRTPCGAANWMRVTRIAKWSAVHAGKPTHGQQPQAWSLHSGAALGVKPSRRFLAAGLLSLVPCRPRVSPGSGQFQSSTRAKVRHDAL